MVVTINISTLERTGNIQRIAGMHGCDDSLWLASLALPTVTLHGYGRTKADALADLNNHFRIWQHHTNAIADALQELTNG
jgi:hypothetical protein